MKRLVLLAKSACEFKAQGKEKSLGWNPQLFDKLIELRKSYRKGD